MWEVTKLVHVVLAEKAEQRRVIIKNADQAFAQFLMMAAEEVGAPRAATFDVEKGCFRIDPNNPGLSQDLSKLTLSGLRTTAENFGIDPKSKKADIVKQIEELKASLAVV